MLYHRQVWQDPRYLERKAAALEQDRLRIHHVWGGGRLHKRGIMPKCVLQLVRSRLPNPTMWIHGPPLGITLPKIQPVRYQCGVVGWIKQTSCKWRGFLNWAIHCTSKMCSLDLLLAGTMATKQLVESHMGIHVSQLNAQTPPLQIWNFHATWIQTLRITYAGTDNSAFCLFSRYLEHLSSLSDKM